MHVPVKTSHQPIIVFILADFTARVAVIALRAEVKEHGCNLSAARLHQTVRSFRSKKLFLLFTFGGLWLDVSCLVVLCLISL